MKRHAARIAICGVLAVLYLAATVPVARSYPPFLKKAKELGMPANDCTYCHVDAKGGQPLGERAKWLVTEKEKRAAASVDVAWLKEYAADATGTTADAATAESGAKNISGSWTMNAEKSKFDGGAPQAVMVKLDHQGSSLSEVITMTTSNGERSYEMKYTLDGTETENQFGNETAKTTAKWEGDMLMINWQTPSGMIIKRKITFSEGTKVMTVAVSRTEPDGEKSDLVVLEQQ